MIPQFPEFKRIEWNDRHDVEQITNSFANYSDFNFTSLCMWNVHDQVLISMLNGNLVVRFSDYLTSDPFFSFIGTNDVNSTADMLIKYSCETIGLCSLKLIPDRTSQELTDGHFTVTPDRGAFDYLLPISFLQSLNTQPAKCKPANRLRQFLNLFPFYKAETYRLSETNSDTLQSIYSKWASNKGQGFRDTHEAIAFERLLKNGNANVLVTIVIIAGKPAGFIINEIVYCNNAICHFFKADIQYNGIYEAVLWEAAKWLHTHGIGLLNFEQDLGIDALRRSKEKYTCHAFLKKYTVQLK